MDGCNSIHDESDPDCVTMESSSEIKKESIKTIDDEVEKTDSCDNEKSSRDSKEEKKSQMKVPPDINKDSSSNEISDKNILDGESLSNHCDSPEVNKEQQVTNSVSEQKSEHPSSDSQLNGSLNSSSNESVYDSVDSNKGDTEENISCSKLNQNKQLNKKRQLKVTKDSDSQDSSDSDIEMTSGLNDNEEKINGDSVNKKVSENTEAKESSEIKISSKPIDCEENDGTRNINITTDAVVKKESNANDGKRQTIIVTETKSLAQVINNAVRKDKGGSQEGKPTLVIIETKSSEPASLSKSSSGTANTITVETGVGKSAATTLTPVSMNSLTLTPTNQSIKTYGNHISSVVSPMIEDGGMAVEVPSLVVPYLIEYPPSRTISEFLKMLPLDPEEIKEIEAASKLKSNNFSSGSASTSTTNTPPPPNPIGRPRAADKWGQYFDSSLGKFFVDIGLNLAKEWVQTDLVKSQKRKAEKEGRQLQQDINLDNLIRNLGDTKEKNEPYHFTLKKCEYCSFKTESILVLKNHYNYPHIHHLDYKCNFCKFHTRVPQDIIFHVEAEHAVQAKLEKPSAFYQCPLCEFEDNSKAKVTKHSFKCQKKFIFEKNLAPSTEFDPPAKRPKVYPIIPPGMTMIPPSGKSYTTAQQLASYKAKNALVRPKDTKLTMGNQSSYRSSLGPQSILPVPTTMGNLLYRSSNVYPQQGSVSRSGSGVAQPPVFLPTNQSLMVNQMLSPSQYQSNQIYQVVNSAGQFVPVVTSNFGQVNSPRFTILPTSNNNNSVSVQGPTPVALVPNIASSSSSRPVLMTGLSRSSQQMQGPKPNISITPVTKPSSVQQSRTRMSTPSTSLLNQRHGGQNSSSFVVCEICDGYIKDLEQLRTHMQWIHKVKIHPKMIFNRPPLNCQKCQFRFFTDQGLERHLLGAHGLVTSSMQENANKGQDSGRCTICGKVFQWKLLAHMSKDHNMILKPAHLSYKCTVCAATFGMYKLFETHVYQAHSTVAKRVLDAPEEKKNKTYPPGPASSKPAEARMSSPSPTLECTECGLPFNRPGNYYRHWEKVHLKPCNIQPCRIDKCLKCLSAFDGKTPWSPCEEIGGEDVINLNRDSELKLSLLNKNITVKNVNSNDESFLKDEEEQKEDEDETGLDMDVEMPDEADDSPISDEIEDEAEETALDMEVESHDPDISSPGSVHTDEEED